jgi:hypothetical protein
MASFSPRGVGFIFSEACCEIPDLGRESLVGQRHFGRHYKHEAQASECFTSRHTRSRFVLVFWAIHSKVAPSN